MLSFLSDQMSLLSAVEFLCLAWRNDAMWFLCLVLKSVFCESNVWFRGVVVVPCDGGLINDWRSKAVTVERAIVLLSAVACFGSRAVFVVFRTCRHQQTTFNLFIGQSRSFIPVLPESAWRRRISIHPPLRTHHDRQTQKQTAKQHSLVQPSIQQERQHQHRTQIPQSNWQTLPWGSQPAQDI